MQERKSATQRGYNDRWRKARTTYLRKHPLCVMCAKLGRTSPATVVDHIEPHRGDQQLFWNQDNWQSLCKPCHDRHKQRLERGSAALGCDLDGIPLDVGHHWRRVGG